MNHKVLILALAALLPAVVNAEDQQMERQIEQLQQQTKALQQQLATLQKQLVKQKKPAAKSQPPQQVVAVKQPSTHPKPPTEHKEADHAPETFHSSAISVHTVEHHPESIGFYPTALMADDRVLTYIAGTPVVTSPYTGERPAFDGSDYIVNISSINRDIRLMQQRRRLYHTYEEIGYPTPNIPIIAISGKAEPLATLNRNSFGHVSGDLTLGSSELDVAAILNKYVEAFMSIAYDESPPLIGGQRLANSSFDLNLGFVNIGNLDESPFYLTAGQLYVPYGKYSSSMISSPITQLFARTKARPFILGYKSQAEKGLYAALYGFSSDVTYGHSGVGGVNVGYTFGNEDVSGEIGGGWMGSLNDSSGMQLTGSVPGTTFGGFGSFTNGSERVGKVPGSNIHANLSIDRYTFTAEWVGATRAFRAADLSFNGRGAKPQATQVEGGVTFKVFDKPASFAVGQQWSRQTLALNLPKSRFITTFNISIWKDTIESLEYHHDRDFGSNTFANGAAPPGYVNENTLGTGKSSDAVVAQIGVYF